MNEKKCIEAFSFTRKYISSVRLSKNFLFLEVDYEYVMVAQLRIISRAIHLLCCIYSILNPLYKLLGDEPLMTIVDASFTLYGTNSNLFENYTLDQLVINSISIFKYLLRGKNGCNLQKKSYTFVALLFYC